jgi:hypothetical protein
VKFVRKKSDAKLINSLVNNFLSTVKMVVNS